MKKLLIYLNAIVWMACYCSCMSNNDKCIRKLLDVVGIEITQMQTATHLVIIPGNGCARCIDKAVSEIHASLDTLYVVVCHSEKEFYLLTGTHRDIYPNVYLDTEGVAVSMKMVGTAPMVYELKDGKFVSRVSYEQETKFQQPILPMTTVSIDKEYVDLGNFSHKERKESSFVIRNTGDDSLHIIAIVSSCDCLETSCSRWHVPSGDTLQLKVLFQSDSIGAFIRNMEIVGNFSSSPLLLTVEGSCN